MINHCIDCKKEIYHTSKRCYSCNNKITRQYNKNCQSKRANEKRQRKMTGRKIHTENFKNKQKTRMSIKNPMFNPETRTKVSNTRIKLKLAKGKKNPNWKGGIQQIKRPRDTTRYKTWRLKVFQRDKYTCQKCGQVGGKLEAHHIKSWKQFPKLRFKIKNGNTLCFKCHPRGRIK